DGIPDVCQPDVRVVPVVTLINPTLTSDARNTLPSSASAVPRGGTYYVEVWASDVGSNNTGLTGVYGDANDCSQTAPTALSNGNIFTVFPSGTIVAGGVDEFGGSALPSGGGVQPQWVRVGWLQMAASVESTACTIALAPSSSGIAAYNRGLVP